MKKVFTVLFCFYMVNAWAQPSKEVLLQTINEVAHYGSTVLLDESGKSRCDYNMTLGEWFPYEEPWHTGQLVWGLLEAYRITGNKEYLDAAKRGGEWWLTLEIKDNPRFKGMVRATHGDDIGHDQIVFSTVTDGTAGIFELTRVTGDKRFARLATSSIQWLLENMYYPEMGVCYDLCDLTTGEITRRFFPSAFQYMECRIVA